MKIQVKTEHFRESNGFMDIFNCPLALAIKDVVPEKTDVRVGGSYLYIGKLRYQISENWMNLAFHINGIIQDAKDGEEIETVTVTLTECYYTNKVLGLQSTHSYI